MDKKKGWLLLGAAILILVIGVMLISNMGKNPKPRKAQVVPLAEDKTLLLLVDRRVSSGTLMKIAGIVRSAGVKGLSVAEKRD